MKSMTTSGIGVLLGGILFANSSRAQEPGGAPEPPPHWIELTDSVGRVIGLTEEQQAGWKERNERWNREYAAMGKEAEKEPSYIKLHSAREFDLKRFLFPAQYDKWHELNKRSPHPERGNPPGTNMPRD